jgi:hypothetical protein
MALPIRSWCAVQASCGLSWDVTGERNNEPGAEVVLYQRHQGDNQKFALEPVEGEWHRIRVKQSGLVLEVRQDAQHRLVQAAETSSLAQLFRFEATSEGAWRVLTRTSGVLTTESDQPLSRVAAQDCSASAEFFRWIDLRPARNTVVRPTSLVYEQLFVGNHWDQADLEKIFEFETGGHGWGNNELQFYTSGVHENAHVTADGLIIEARREAHEGMEYTSARLRTHGKWLYGRFEIVAKLPTGRGTWPALWMLPPKPFQWPADGELDIMEHVGFDAGRVHANVHTGAYNHVIGTNKGACVEVQRVTDYHTYVMEWGPDSVAFFLDDGGEPYFEFTRESNDVAKWPFDKPFQLMLNVAVGGNWGGLKGIDSSWNREQMIVQSIRVFQ